MTKEQAGKILILGGSGMLGNAVLRFFASQSKYEVVSSIRSASDLRRFPVELRHMVIAGVEVGNLDEVSRVFALAQPKIVINCVGLIKQLPESHDPLAAISINAVLPHRLARLCELAGARLIHVSTDCVFSGSRGMYRESDNPDASDLYGRSKLLGEVDYPHAVTLRTSLIGHELDSARSLVGWFLAQEGPVKGFTRAIFSGLPTVEMARVIHDFVMPNSEMRGVYHVSVDPISKHDLLRLIAETYERGTEILPDDGPAIDRSLDSTRFREITGYRPPRWSELVRQMRDFH
jgi:dTDP-4-dehydrorhamnose reductase